MGIPGALYISELLGAILLFVGFLRATTPMQNQEKPVIKAVVKNQE
jgi:hypothetical protein